MPDKNTKNNVIKNDKDNNNKEDNSDLENIEDAKLLSNNFERGYGRFGGRSFRNNK